MQTKYYILSLNLLRLKFLFISDNKGKLTQIVLFAMPLPILYLHG